MKYTMCDTMNDYQDDSDGELPSISLSQSTGVKTEFEMPPAEEVVSQREREAAVERALQELRDAEAAAAAEAAARRKEKDEQMLSSKVTALEVSDVSEARRRQAAELAALAGRLPPADAAFLAAYAAALNEARSEAAAQAITNQVVSAVCSALVRGAPVAAGGAAAALLTAPPAPRTRRALHAVLDRVASTTQVEMLVTACRAALRGAARRLAAHDAARSGARRGSDRLATALLASAMHEILHGSDSPSPPSPLSAEVAAAARVQFRRLPAHRQLLLLRGAGRALEGGAVRGEGQGADLVDALVQPLPRAPQAKAGGDDVPVDVSLRHQVLANVAKLQLLFGAARAPPKMDESREQIMVKTESESDNSQTEEKIVSKDIDEEMVSTTEIENNHLNIATKDTAPEELPKSEYLQIKEEQTDATVHMDSKTTLKKEAEEIAEVTKEATEVKEEMEVDTSSPQRKKTRRSPRPPPHAALTI